MSATPGQGTVRRHAVFLGLLLATGTWRVLHAQPARVTSELSEVADGRTRAMLLAVVRDAEANGIPLAPLYGKIREGTAKQSPPNRITDAVRALATRLATSREALASASSVDEIAAGAEALLIGVPASALRQLRQVWPAQLLTVPLGVVTELVAYGVSASHATARVRELMESGATNAQLVGLSTRVQSDIVSGTAASAAFERRARSAFGVLSAQQAKTGSSLLAIPPRPD